LVAVEEGLLVHLQQVEHQGRLRFFGAEQWSGGAPR
jgi:hypothetical protein